MIFGRAAETDISIPPASAGNVARGGVDVNTKNAGGAEKETGDAVASAISTDEGSSPSSEETIGDFLSRVKNKNVVGVKKLMRVRIYKKERRSYREEQPEKGLEPRR